VNIFVRSGGSGPVVVLLHGYAETSDSWAPLVTALMKNYTVVVPDLRGIGRSSRPAGGYDKKTQAAGTSGVSGIRTVGLKGDPDRAGLYTIMLQVPAHMRTASHDHQDNRVATVVAGTWFLGYGEAFDPAQLKAVPPGSFYTEPAKHAHFAETGDSL